MKTKHLAYYMDKVTIPVFLFVVDVGSKIGYYLFLQDWIDQSAPAAWRQRKTVSVIVPETNRLDNKPAFLTAIGKSVVAMRDRHPGSIEAAVQKEIAAMAAIDPRIAIRMDLVGGRRQFHLSPKEPVRFKIAARPGNEEKLRRHLKYGVPLEVPVSGIQIVDMPLFQKIADENSRAVLAIDRGGKRECEVEFEVRGCSKGRPLRLRGTFARGTIGFHIDCRLSGAPMRVEINATEDDLASRSGGDLSLSMDLGAWEGRPILDLPHFDSVYAFLENLRGGATVGIEVVVEGQTLARGTLGNLEATVMDGQFGVLRSLDRGRIVARRLRVSPTMPPASALTIQVLKDVQRAHDLVIHGTHQEIKEGLSFSGTVDIADSSTAESLTGWSEGLFKTYQPSQSVRVFDTSVDLGPVEVMIDPARLQLGPEVDGSTERRVTVKGIGKATLRIRSLNAEESRELWPQG